jgi:hypothetical protein
MPTWRDKGSALPTCRHSKGVTFELAHAAMRRSLNQSSTNARSAYGFHRRQEYVSPQADFRRSWSHAMRITTYNVNGIGHCLDLSGRKALERSSGPTHKQFI